jgi:hypothetical protein
VVRYRASTGLDDVVGGFDRLVRGEAFGGQVSARFRVHQLRMTEGLEVKPRTLMHFGTSALRLPLSPRVAGPR